MAISDVQFIALWMDCKSPTKVSSKIGISVRNVLQRRRRIETKYSMTLPVDDFRHRRHHEIIDHPAVHNLDVQDGVVLVASDAHYWPGIITTGHMAFVQFCKELQPKAIVMNGDVVDGAQISRHPPIGWESRPSLIQELETCQQRLSEISDACKNAKKIWNLGNHDSRFETRLASAVPEYAKVTGVHLKDHFPGWQPAWSTWINEDVVIKHRFKNGIHATHNNTVNAGKTMVTGHLHSLKVTPFSDYNGTRWGVDTGCLAPIYGPQTSDYCETSPVNWRQGFVVLTFHKGRLLWPELVHVCGQDEIQFRGKVHKVEQSK